MERPPAALRRERGTALHCIHCTAFTALPTISPFMHRIAHHTELALWRGEQMMMTPPMIQLSATLPALCASACVRSSPSPFPYPSSSSFYANLRSLDGLVMIMYTA